MSAEQEAAKSLNFALDSVERVFANARPKPTVVDLNPEIFILVSPQEVDELLAKIEAPDCSAERRRELIRVLADSCKAEMEFNSEDECPEDVQLFQELVGYAVRTISTRNPIAKPQDVALLGRVHKRFPVATAFFDASGKVAR